MYISCVIIFKLTITYVPIKTKYCLSLRYFKSVVTYWVHLTVGTIGISAVWKAKFLLKKEQNRFPTSLC